MKRRISGQFDISFSKDGEALPVDDIASMLTIHHDAVKAVAEKSHYEVVRTYPNGGKDVRKVVDVAGVEARPAWDETEDIQVYIPYTAEELARMQKQAEEARANSLENQVAELQAAVVELGGIIAGLTAKQGA